MSDLQESSEPDLRDYLSVLRRRKAVVMSTLAVVVGAAFAVSFIQAPAYQAEAKVLLQARPSEQIVSSGQALNSDAQRVQTEIEVMKSSSVREAAARRIGHPVEVSVRVVGQTNIVAIRAESSGARQAAREADLYAEAYIDTRRQQLIDDLLSAAEQVKAEVDDLQRQIDDLTAPLAALDARIVEAASQPAREALVAERVDEERRIATRREALEKQQTFYAQQLDQLQLAGNLTQTGGGQVVSKAEVPTAPVRPTPVKNAMLALVAGTIFGLGLAFLFEYLDDTIRSKDDVDRSTGGLAVLGLIPEVAGWKDRDKVRLVSLSDANSAASEAYRSLRTSVQFLGLARRLGIIQMTSPSASEGKTTTLANLAVALARADQRVAVVCCDLRRPRVHEFFGLSNSVGLTSVLVGAAPLATALQQVPAHDRILLLASGPSPPNPSELLASARVAEVLTALQAEVDVVLIDSPPVLPVTDGMIIAGLVDATILVTHAGRTTRKNARRAAEVLRQVDAPLVGAVLNGVEAEDGYAYNYGYRARHVDRSEGRGRSKRRRSKDTEPEATVARPGSGEPASRPA